MAYEMLINAGVTGQAQVEGLGKATDDLSARTAKLNEVMYGEGTAIKQLAFGLEKLTATSIASAQANNQLSVRLVEVMERMTAAKMAGAGLAGANDQVAASSERASIGTRNMTATLRGLEGAMPLRAAASLLTSFSALGPIAQVAFQVVGVVAMGSVLASIGEKLGIHLNFWKQIADMQKQSNKELQESSEKYATNLKELRDINDEEYKRSHGGAMAGAQIATRTGAEAATTLTARVRSLEQQLAVAQKILSMPMSALQGGSEFGAPRAIFNTLTPQERAIAGEAGIPDLMSAELIGGNQLAAAELAKRNLTSLTGPLAVARIEQEKAMAKTNELAMPKKDPDEVVRERITKAQEASQKAQKQAEERAAHIAELTARSQDIYARGLYSGEPAPERVRNEALQRIREQRSMELSKAQPGESGQINSAFDKQVSGTWLTYMTESTKALKEFTDKVTNAAESAQKEVESAEERARKGPLEWYKEDQGIFGPIGTPLTGIPSAEQQLRDAGRTGQRMLALSHAQGQLGGVSPQVQADQAYQIRIDTANKEFEALVRKSNKEDAIAATEEKYFEAQMEHQQALLEIAVKQKQETAEMAGSLFDAIKGRTTNQWWRSMAAGQEKQLFENAASIPLGHAREMLGGLVPNVGPLGTLLHGTLLDNANGPAEKTEKNTAATVSELQKMNRALTGSPATGPGGIPTLSSIGDIGGIGNGTSGLMGTGIGTGGSGPSGLLKSYSGSVFSQFSSGLGAGGDNPLQAIATGTASGTGWAANLTDAQRVGVATGTAALLAGAGMAIASGVSQGGAGGGLKAASGALAAASLIPGAAIFTAPAAAALGLASMFFTPGPEQRAGQIFNELSKGTYLAPTAMNITQGMNGTYEDFGTRGNLRTSSMSAYPTVAEPYITSRVYQGQRTYYDVPGQTTSPYSGGATGTGQTPVSNASGGVVQIFNGPISAIDPSSFHELAQRPAYSHSIGESVATHLQSHEGRLSNAIRYIAGA